MARLDRAFGLTATVFLALAAARLAGAEDGGLVDVTRSAESRFVHRSNLLDEKGNPIKPDSTVPYSPRMTCTSSRCHNYDLISQGTHIRMFPSAAPDPKRPSAFVWTKFDAATGVTAPLSHGFLPDKAADFDPKAHLTAFEFATQFGAFHPGGGRLELDSAAKRYDARLAEAEKPAPNDPDYYEAAWDQSGVLEVDCMACHALQGYDHTERAEQINLRNFRWAPTVGAGFGVVEGRAEARKVKYDPAIFDPDGKVHLEVGRPPDHNCLYCHRRPAAGKTDWADCLAADVHSKAGLRCADCHATTASHVMAGPSTASMPDFASLTCNGCHTSGRLGAPLPAHPGLPRIHLEKIACEVCHAGPRPRQMPLALEQPTDPTWGVILNTKRAAGPAVFAPVYARGEGGQIQMFLRMLPAYYANRTEKGLVPLEPRSLLSRFQRARGELKDDDGDGQPEVNTDAEINAVLKAIKRKGVNPVYLVGGLAYGLDDKGELRSEPNPLSNPIDQPLAHNVRPGPQALGAAGCAECHHRQAPLFQSIALTRELDNRGKPEGQPLVTRLGRPHSYLLVSEIREVYIRPFGPLAIGLALLAMALHLVIFGPRRFEQKEGDELVLRFGWLTRLAHFTLLGSFVVLAITGLFIAGGVERVFGAATDDIHQVVSWALVGAAAVAFLLWVRDMLFARHDIGWLKVMGGYLGYKGHVPAGRFNAGQKLFFWLVLPLVGCLAVTGWVMIWEGPEPWLSLAYTLHTLCAYLMILFILGHAYLGSFANPGTLPSIFTGMVPRSWLDHHHPNYALEQKKTT